MVLNAKVIDSRMDCRQLERELLLALYRLSFEELCHMTAHRVIQIHRKSARTVEGKRKM